MLNRLYNEDCLEVLKRLEDNSIDAIVTDPPYNLGFMSKGWDKTGIAFNSELWKECLRVVKPGGNLLSFGGTRTYHRMVCAIEDAGWQIRDTIMWVYGSGFPKSLDISKAIDKTKGAERKIVGQRQDILTKQNADLREGYRKILDSFNAGAPGRNNGFKSVSADITAPATPEAKLWEGYGTGLKPAYEPIVLAMKSLDGTFAKNCLKWGIAGLNIDECRISTDWTTDPTKRGWQGGNTSLDYDGGNVPIHPGAKPGHKRISHPNKQGRFPANFIHDGSQEVMELFPNTKTGWSNKDNQQGESVFGIGNVKGKEYGQHYIDNSGSAARFFYCAKASRRERDEGLEDMPDLKIDATVFNPTKPICNICGCGTLLAGAGKRLSCGHNDYHFEPSVGSKEGGLKHLKNAHPTVKPLALMEYLVKLVTRPGHLVLDPFLGSGTTAIACKKLGRYYIGCEIDRDYYAICQKRIEAGIC